MGHLVRFRDLAVRLTEAGHRVVFAVRDVARAGKVYADIAAEILPAACKVGFPDCRIEPTATYAQLLHDCGYEHPSELTALLKAWKSLYAYVVPDLVILDHSPTALLALRGTSIKRVLTGTGFVNPPDVYPLPVLQPGIYTEEHIRNHEDGVLRVINESLAAIAAPPIERIGQPFSEVDEILLATFRELDHYENREGRPYWGITPYCGGAKPNWPRSDRRKVFAYLKPSPQIPALFDLLNKLELPTLVYVDGIDKSVQQRFGSRTLQFVERPLDLDLVSADCYCAILNGTHSTTAKMLLAGKPLLLMPLTLEQAVMANRLAKLGAAAVVTPDDEKSVYRQMASLLNEDSYALAAASFAHIYKGFDARLNLQRWTTRIMELLPA